MQASEAEAPLAPSLAPPNQGQQSTAEEGEGDSRGGSGECLVCASVYMTTMDQEMEEEEALTTESTPNATPFASPERKSSTGLRAREERARLARKAKSTISAGE